MNLWGPALLAVVVQVVIAVYIYGGIGRAVRDHDQQFRDVARDQNSQWEAITQTQVDIGNIRGKMNGGHYKP